MIEKVKRNFLVKKEYNNNLLSGESETEHKELRLWNVRLVVF